MFNEIQQLTRLAIISSVCPVPTQVVFPASPLAALPVLKPGRFPARLPALILLPRLVLALAPRLVPPQVLARARHPATRLVRVLIRHRAPRPVLFRQRRPAAFPAPPRVCRQRSKAKRRPVKNLAHLPV
jgi:hypothetical protein